MAFGIVLGETPSDPSAEALLSVGNQSAAEGDAGQTNMTFPVSRAVDGQGGLVHVRYWTSDNDAIAGVDYVETRGSFNLAEGGSAQVDVPIIGDTDVEDDELFNLHLRGSWVPQ
jgi:hypothetical protein